MNEFVRWVAGAGGRCAPHPDDVALYQQALLLRQFPQYRFEDLHGRVLITLMRALKLLDLARKVQE